MFFLSYLLKANESKKKKLSNSLEQVLSQIISN